MNYPNYLLLLVFCICQISIAQTILNANGPGNTYEDINAVLAPGFNVIEVPDCSHATSVEHIDEVFDTEMNTNVFRFIAHKTPDNDRCQNFDRQRTEIKTYDKSPDNLLAVEGEIVQYKWKFKIPSDFQVSSSFTHLHQIKSVDGPYASIPMITLTARKATPDRLELRYTPINNQTTIGTADLDLFRGHWVEVTETILYANAGSYDISITKISDNSILFSYNDTSVDMWQDGSSFARPKWGIYRSLNSIDDLQDETVLFNSFSIEENVTLSSTSFKNKIASISLYPNPARSIISIKNIDSNDYDGIKIYDSSGKLVLKKSQNANHNINISSLGKGFYFINIMQKNKTIKVLKCILE